MTPSVTARTDVDMRLSKLTAGRRAVAPVAAFCALIAAGAAGAADKGTTSAAVEGSPAVSGGAVVPAPTPVMADIGGRGLLTRHWFKGLLCAGFLVICAAAVSGTDRPGGDARTGPAPKPEPDGGSPGHGEPKGGT